MSVRYQLVIDAQDPELLAQFWAEALNYILEPPPTGFPTWDAWRADLGLPESGMGPDSIIDPTGSGPRIWFRQEPTPKTLKNRLHLDIHASSDTSITDRTTPLATRKARVDAKATHLAALGATITGPLSGPDDLAHYAVGMKDPENNEFDIN
ncbi:VOC family protein [Kribbella sp. NPDC055071]